MSEDDRRRNGALARASRFFPRGKQIALISAAERPSEEFVHARSHVGDRVPMRKNKWIERSGKFGIFAKFFVDFPFKQDRHYTCGVRIR
jgi:hypothetical protein